MKSIVTSLLLVLFSIQSSYAQLVKSEWEGKKWTDGISQYKATILPSGQLLLEGNGYFDAGYGSAFTIQKSKENEWQMTPLQTNQVKLPANYFEFFGLNEPQEGVYDVRRIIDKHDVIIRMNNGKTTNAFELIKSGKHMNDITEAQVKQSISGSYVDKDGQKYSFAADGKALFAGKATKYTILKDHSVPSQIIKLANGTIYEIKTSLKGMTLSSGNYDTDSEEFTATGKSLTLTFDKDQPRWQWTSNTILTEHALSMFPEDKTYLRLMRNEIWARHGYRFTDTELVKYFNECKWYKPVSNNNQIQLTETESFNVALIKSIENRYQE